MRKKIIFVSTALWIGGIETSLINLLNHFNYEKYDVTLLILQGELNMKDQVNPNCRLLIADREKTFSFAKPYRHARLYHLTEQSQNPSALHRAFLWTVPMIKAIEQGLYTRYIREMLKGEQFDTCVLYSDAIAYVLPGIPAARFLLYYHHGAMRRKAGDGVAYRKCEKILAVSDYQASQLRKFLPRVAAKITVIHNQIDAEVIRQKAAQPTEESFDSSKFNIVSVGRVSHEKGMDLAVRACAKLVSEGYDQIRWWIVGDGPAMGEVKDAIRQCRMEDYVITVGMKDNPYPYIRQADLYVQPSRFEGYPMTVLEALVLGQPVISTDNKGAREILEEGQTGLLCGLDAECIAGEIIRLYNNAEIIIYMKDQVGRLDFAQKNRQCMKLLEELLLTGPKA